MVHLYLTPSSAEVSLMTASPVVPELESMRSSSANAISTVGVTNSQTTEQRTGNVVLALRPSGTQRDQL